MPESFSQPAQPALPPPSPAPECYEPIHPGSGRPGAALSVGVAETFFSRGL
jgi:hypothetical protein